MLISYRGKTPKVHPSAFVAPTAVLIGDVEVGEQSSIWFGAVIRGDNGPIRIGDRSNVQDNAVVHVGTNSRTIIGNDVTIGHAAIMEDCVIEDGALIGSNVVILNYTKIGRRSLVAAGSVVPTGMEVPAEVVVAGAPAKVKKALDGASVIWVDHAGPEYVHLSRSYLEHGIGNPDTHELRETVSG
jgi:carbonic anhydrase/acetyltransferase-like protein (isoleucine patch superfamily)